MNGTTTRRAGWFLLAGGLGFALLLSLLIPGMAPWTPQATAMIKAAQESCEVTYFALDPDDPTRANPDKEVPAAFGPEVTARGEKDVKAELRERRACDADGRFDPALTASHYATWSEVTNLTSMKVTYAEIDAFYAKIAADKTLYGKVLAELEKLEGESTYSEESVSAGVWSLYMNPNGSGEVTVKQGQTSTKGTNAVFTHGKFTIKYRLDCGFQPNRDKKYPVDECTPEECPRPECPEDGKWPNCKPYECPEGTVGTYPDCNNVKWRTPTTKNPGWTPRGTDNGVTDGKQSSDQIRSGDTRGNAVDDQVDDSKKTHNGGTTPDTKKSDDGGPVAEGAEKGGDDPKEAVQDEDLVNDDTGGTDGDTCVPTPLVSC